MKTVLADAPERPDPWFTTLHAGIGNRFAQLEHEVRVQREQAVAWEAVARNLAQVLDYARDELGKAGLRNTDDDAHHAADTIALTFTKQCAAHGVTP